MPTGLELGDGGVYVAQGTELLHLRDTDGDGRADTRRIVLGGFGTADSHQMINCINWGFGGELWFTQGHHIYSRVETPFGVETLNRAGHWRYRPRSGHLDPFFPFSSAGANCWGRHYHGLRSALSQKRREHRRLFQHAGPRALQPRRECTANESLPRSHQTSRHGVHR